MSLKSIVGSLLLTVFMTACSNDPLAVDVTNQKTGILFTNLDSLFVHTAPNDLSSLHQKSLSELGEIYKYELGYCLQIGNESDTAFQRGLGQFLSEPYIQRLERRIQEKTGDLKSEKKAIDDGFKHLKAHFRKGKLPKHVVFMNSLFASSVFSTEGEIGVGLERYLGMETDVIKELPYQDFPDWQKEGMDKNYIPRDVLASWIETHYAEEVDGNLAEKIVRWGKVLYLTQAAFPDKDPAYILRYSQKDYDWAIENEYALWKYLVDEKILFKIDELNTKNLLGDGPFTPGLPEKGPDRLGQFLGYRIILKYMEINRISLEELLKITYSDILVEYEID